MMQFRKKSKKLAKTKDSQRTAITFTAAELAQLGSLLAAGYVVLQPQERLPILARLKAAMTRLGVAIPRGLERVPRTG